MDDALLDEQLGERLYWTPSPFPPHVALAGRYVDLVPMDAADHAAALYEATHGADADPALWLYLPYGPFPDLAAFTAYISANEASHDPLYYTVIPHGQGPSGQVTLMRIDAKNGVVETGHIWFAASMQRSPAGTEAIYLLARHVFDDLGYRRFEWKCHDRNARSKAAARRFGFTFEGIFRQAVVVRDRNRDTAWFSITDGEWPAVKAGFEAWLHPDNFDDQGHQRRSLIELRQHP